MNNVEAMKKLRTWIKRAFCDHHIRLENMRRLDDELVVCPCHLCGAVLTARYGAALSGRWVPDAAGVIEDPAPERWALTAPAIAKRVGGDFEPQQVWPAGTVVVRTTGVEVDRG